MVSQINNKINSEPDLNEEVKRLLKAELSRRGISHQMLSDLFDAAGFNVTKASIDSKLSRGSFSAGFLLHCLQVIGCKEIRIEPERHRRAR